MASSGEVGDESLSQFEVSNPPGDGITAVRFSDKSNRLVASSWDKSVTVYEIDDAECSSKVAHSFSLSDAVLDCCFAPQSENEVYAGSCDGALSLCDVERASVTRVGGHSAPIRKVKPVPVAGLLATGGWDSTLKLWDYRTNTEVHSLKVPSKVFALGVSLYRVIVGCANREVIIFDSRNLGGGSAEQERESSLKHQTRHIEGHPNGKQFIMASIEGRVGVEYFDASAEAQSKKYAFKCHRLSDKQSGTQTVYPVNCVGFHPLFHTFATGGCDGVINVWDGDSKKRITQFPAFATSVSSLEFSRAKVGLLAIAQSYTWELGPQRHPKDAIFIRKLKDSDVKPKSRTRKKR